MKILLSAILLTATGCVKVTPKGDNNTGATGTGSSATIKPKASVETSEVDLRGLDIYGLSDEEILKLIRSDFVGLEPKTYAIRLKFPSQIARAEITREGQVQQVQANAIDLGYSVGEIGPFPHDQEVQVRWMLSLERVIEQRLKIPRDLVFPQDADLTASAWGDPKFYSPADSTKVRLHNNTVKAQRIFFEGELQLPNFTEVVFQAEEIHILGVKPAVIRDQRGNYCSYGSETQRNDFWLGSYQPPCWGLGTFYPFGRQGSSGSKLTFRAKRLTGRLDVHLKGRDGWDGRPGYPHEQIQEDKSEPQPIQYSSGHCSQISLPNGKQGDDGARGKRGGDGGRGGHGGILTLDIEDQSQGEVRSSFSPGKGGRGGLGGIGQKGGPGRLAPQVRSVTPNPNMKEGGRKVDECGRGSRGRPGRDGDPGQPGNPGDPGRPGQLCEVKLGQTVCVDR